MFFFVLGLISSQLSTIRMKRFLNSPYLIAESIAANSVTMTVGLYAPLEHLMVRGDIFEIIRG